MNYTLIFGLVAIAVFLLAVNFGAQLYALVQTKEDPSEEDKKRAMTLFTRLIVAIAATIVFTGLTLINYLSISITLKTVWGFMCFVSLFLIWLSIRKYLIAEDEKCKVDRYIYGWSIGFSFMLLFIFGLMCSYA